MPTEGPEIWRETLKKREKMRNVHCRTWYMARKLKITENDNNTRQVVKYDEKY